MTSANDLDLLGEFTRDQSQDAFTALVQRHLALVYCAALRQVRSPELAEEVAQSVFIDLARAAARLNPDTILTAWLYKVTRRTAINVVRGESRRQLREQIASEMNAMNVNADDWTLVEPFLDEAMDTLDDTDRTAVLLRYFENKSLREVGATLGTTDDTARKRINRAVQRLREFFAHRGVTVGASGLVVVLSTNAVQAAPPGLVLTISTTAALGGTTIAGTATAAATKAIVMTTTQKIIITTVLAAAVSTGIYEARQASVLRSKNQSLERQLQSRATEPTQLSSDGDNATRQLAALRDENERLHRNNAELLKLRAEIASLRNRAPELTEQKATELQTENKALREKTNQLWQSLVGYINAYSNSIPPEKRWAYSLAERKRFSLVQAEEGGYVLRRKGGDGTDHDFFSGKFTSMGIGENHIFIRIPAFKDDPEGWRIIDLRTGAVNGPYGDTEFMGRPEVGGVRFMKPEEAWEVMK